MNSQARLNVMGTILRRTISPPRPTGTECRTPTRTCPVRPTPQISLDTNDQRGLRAPEDLRRAFLAAILAGRERPALPGSHAHRQPADVVAILAGRGRPALRRSRRRRRAPCPCCDPRWPRTASAAHRRRRQPRLLEVVILADRGRASAAGSSLSDFVVKLLLRSSLTADGQRCTSEIAAGGKTSCCDPHWPRTASAARPRGCARLGRSGCDPRWPRTASAAIHPLSWCRSRLALRSSLAASGQRCRSTRDRVPHRVHGVAILAWPWKVSAARGRVPASACAGGVAILADRGRPALQPVDRLRDWRSPVAILAGHGRPALPVDLVASRTPHDVAILAGCGRQALPSPQVQGST